MTAPTVPASRFEDPDPGAFVRDCLARDDHLLYLALNVGDGDTQLLVLPRTPEEPDRRVIVVDIATTKKVPALIESLEQAGILPAGQRRRFPIVVGTHPHEDHIGGMEEFLGAYGDQVDEYWEPGFYHPGSAFIETLTALEDLPHVQRAQPTSGYTRFLDHAKLTVLAPGIVLRGRFDTYGTEINDASIALKIEFPVTRVTYRRSTEGRKAREREYLRLDEPWSIILGADAQFTSWAQTTLDFPQLHHVGDAALYEELKAAMGPDPLRAQVFKVPHHASKHGLNIELVERVNPSLSVVSSVGGGGKYGFPHMLAIEALREARQPTTTKDTPRKPDHELGIHYTSARLAAGDGSDLGALGSFAVLVPPKRGQRLRVWRLGDEHRDTIDFSRARLMKQRRG